MRPPRRPESGEPGAPDVAGRGRDDVLVHTRPLVIGDHNPAWPEDFRRLAGALRAQLGDDALRVDHIGSTAVPGLAGKDVIDIQVTVRDLAHADRWPDELPPGALRRPNRADHAPAGAASDPREWTKRYWSDRRRVHIHVREQGRLNQRYALLFRDYLRADTAAARGYGAVKRALAAAAAGDRDAYYAVKDPVCDLILAGAEHWARQTDWRPSPADA
jgi:GrpB-like predicted nucleotidyltransferase (UPF0157 family)